MYLKDNIYKYIFIMAIIFPELEELLYELLSIKPLKKTSFNSFIVEHIERKKKSMIIKKIIHVLNNIEKDTYIESPDLLIIYSKL